MPVSRDPEKRARQLANLRPAPAAPAGHSASMQSGSLAAPRSRGLGPTPALTPQAA